MAVRFVLGRAGTGKTRHCLDAILAELDRPTGDFPLLLIVPEQASFQMERALAARSARRGYSRAEVLSFSRLATRVFDRLGSGPAELTPQTRVLALRAIAAGDPQVVRSFGPAARTQGFFDRMARLIEELLRENVPVDSLQRAASTLPDVDGRQRVAAVAGLLRRYLETLGAERCDPALRLARLRERLADSTWVRDAAVWVDGFAGFTGQESETLIALAGMARSVEITLLLDPVELLRPGPDLVPDELRLFHRTERTYKLLHKAMHSRAGVGSTPPQRTPSSQRPQFIQGELFADARIEMHPPVLLNPGRPPRFAAASALAMLEHAFVHGPDAETRAVPSADGVRILSCETHRAEMRQAARFIRTSIVESGGALRYRDFAIIARDLEPFHRLAAETLREFEIPYFLDRRRSLASHALVRFVGALLGAARRDAPLPLMVRLLQSALLPFPRATCERLENLALAHEPVGVAAWREPVWARARRGRDAAPDPLSRDLHTARMRLVEAIAPLAELSQRDQPPAGAEWYRTLLAVLESLAVRRQMSDWIRAARAGEQWDVAETHRLAWETLCGVLDDVLSVLGQTALRADEFATIVESSLAGSTLGLAPPTVDQVLVSSIERSRHPEIKHAWLFAFNEGIFPARPPDDLILSESERSALVAAGLPAPAPARDDAFSERLLAYIAATRPSRTLNISFARLSIAGDDLFPSPLLADIRRALPGVAIETPADDEHPSTLSELAQVTLKSSTADARLAVLDQEVRQDSAARSTLDRLLRGRDYRNLASPIPRRTTLDESGYLWYGSPSELETAVQCPFRWFSRRVLRIEEHRGPVPVEWELGSIAHQVIADVCARAIVEYPDIRNTPDERWAEWTREAFENLSANEPAQAELRTLRAALEPFVRQALLAHAARWRRGRFNLLATEERFGRKSDCERHPALQIELPGIGLIGLRAIVDRLDGFRDDRGRLQLLVYDYKSTPRSLRWPFLTGERLQVLAYLLAAVQAYAGPDSPAVAAGVLLAPLYPNRAVLEEQAARGGDEEVGRMKLYRPTGVFDQYIAKALDETVGPETSPVANMRMKKAGGFYANCDARPADEIAARLALARQTIIQTARGIIEGRVDVAPLVEGRRLACGTCAYRSICRFDTAFNRPRAAEHVLPLLPTQPDDDAECQ